MNCLTQKNAVFIYLSELLVRLQSFPNSIKAFELNHLSKLVCPR